MESTKSINEAPDTTDLKPASRMLDLKFRIGDIVRVKNCTEFWNGKCGPVREIQYQEDADGSYLGFEVEITVDGQIESSTFEDGQLELVPPTDTGDLARFCVYCANPAITRQRKVDSLTGEIEYLPVCKQCEEH